MIAIKFVNKIIGKITRTNLYFYYIKQMCYAYEAIISRYRQTRAIIKIMREQEKNNKFVKFRTLFISHACNENITSTTSRLLKEYRYQEV